MSNLSRDNYKYIYNISLANYMMINGVVCKGTGINKRTGQTFWCFDANECQVVFDKIERNKKRAGAYA